MSVSTISIRLLFFGPAREATGTAEHVMQCPDNCTVNDVKQLIERAFPMLQFQNNLAFAVNQQLAAATTLVHDGDTVAIIPPVSGG